MVILVVVVLVVYVVVFVVVIVFEGCFFRLTIVKVIGIVSMVIYIRGSHLHIEVESICLFYVFEDVGVSFQVFFVYGFGVVVRGI